MFGGLFNINFTDYKGGPPDARFIDTAPWLTNTAVIKHIYETSGRWRITLVFAWKENPLQFICRYMVNDFSTRKKAAVYADYYARTSQKDRRGTLKININDFDICFN